MMDNLFKSFQLSTLCVAIICASTTTFAVENLEQLDDFELEATTGEGIAMLPENAYMVFRGAGANESTATILTDRTRDTGYINYIPVGPLTTEAIQSGAGKADVYLYGLSISKGGQGNTADRISSTNPEIYSWGTPTNPWLLKVNTEHQVPNFGTTACVANDPSCKVTALILEAPLHNIYANTNGSATGTMPTTSQNGLDAYKLKLSMWADAFVRDPTKAEGAADQFNLGGANRANRLRLQAIWDGLSINGSNIKMFQTLGGAAANNPVGQTRDTSYNNTFGMSGVLRFNSGDTRNLKLGYTDNVVGTIGTATGWQTLHAGTDPNLGSTGTGCNNGGTGAFNTTVGCQYRIQVNKRTDTKTTTRTFNLNNPNQAGTLRFSTQETGTGYGLLDSPAISNTPAPTFNANEGLFLYGANINLVIGNLYQPLIFNKDQNSNNFSMEVTRIPNKHEIYSKIYTRYSGDTGDSGVTYLGSTCSVYACGTPISINGVTTYQGNTATHSSISIGTTNYNATTGLMTAYTGADAVGVSFGKVDVGSFSANTSATAAIVQYQQRSMVSGGNWCGYWARGDGTSCLATNRRYAYNWAYQNSATGTSTVTPPTLATVHTGCTSRPGVLSGACTSNNADTYSSASNRNWDTSGAAWRTVANTAVDNFIGAANGKTGSSALPTANQAPAAVLPTTSNNNFGSAVIDGLLIQHMKITTKGL